MSTIDISFELKYEAQSYARSFPCEFVHTRNTEFEDIKSGRYLNFLVNTFVLNYGFNNPIFMDVLSSHLKRGSITISLCLHTAKQHFLELIQEIVFKPR